jgi:hypothetical protein
VRALLQLEPVAGLHAQRFEYSRREGDLALGSDLDEHREDSWNALPMLYISKEVPGVDEKPRSGHLFNAGA